MFIYNIEDLDTQQLHFKLKELLGAPYIGITTNPLAIITNHELTDQELKDAIKEVKKQKKDYLDLT